ncbi:MAG TPA: GAF domain-containing protein [Methylomirabilota bacterium]|nr:GAF domain-containing protein [Methylomirabilota bacterium]
MPSLRLDDALREVATSAAALMGAPLVTIWTADEQARTVERRAASDDRFTADYPTAIQRYGQGGAGLVAEQRRPLFIRSIAADRRFLARDWFRSHGFTSYAGLPILLDGCVLGVLSVLGRKPFRLGPGDRRRLEGFTVQAAVAIRNARLFAQSEARRRTAEALAEIGRALSQVLDPQVVAQRIIESVRTLLHGESSALYRLDPSSGDLVVVAQSTATRSPFAWAPVLIRGTGIGSIATQLGHPVASADCLVDQRLSYTPEVKAAFSQSAYRAVLSTPLIAQGRVLGVLNVADRTGRRFDEEDSQVAQAFTDRAATALENARLYDEARRRQREGEALARVARTLTESLAVADVAKRIVESVVPLFGARSSGLRLLQPDGSLQSVARSDHAGAHSDPGDVLPPGMGISRRAVTERRPVRTRNVLTEPGVSLPEELRQRVLAAGEIAFMAVPLQVKGQIIGALTLADREGREFTDAEAALLQAFADQAAAAISNAQLFEREQAARARAESSEAALRESEERYRSVVENASDLITVMTPQGVIEYESPSVERLLGWRPEELVGKQVMDYVHADDVTLLTEAIARRLADPVLVNPPVEFRVRARDGSWRVLAATSRVIRGETGAVTLVATSRDVTERRALEEQLRQAQRLESIGRLAGGVAHDFNNLLTVIGGRAQLLLSRLPSGDPSRRDVELIKKTGARAAQLTQQLLAFSRRQVLQPKILDLNGVITGLEGMLRRLIGEDIELVTDLVTGLGTVLADPGQLEQVIMNLALNARDAMPTGGRLTIRTATAGLGAQDPVGFEALAAGPYVLLTVSDTGVGMDEATRAHIFEPFFTTKDVGKGSGLGLATVYGIVKQSGGHITAESEPGHGTTFAIYLPEAHGAVAAPESSQALEDAPRGVETILLVEDEAEVRDLARDILELGGYQVLEATTPEDAERICRDERSPIHLLLTDVVMPQMSGRMLAERLMAARPAMRVLYMSGYTGDTIVQHGVEGQGPGFLPKPFTPNDLSRKVREVLDAGA